jgi:cell division protein FtsI/penicillin-binding protein 2
MEPAWLAQLVTAMEAVTRWGGTAGGVAPYDFPAAMKTGTGGNYRDGFHVNYIGFCPAEFPEFVFCVRITGKSRSVEARRAGHQVTRSLLWTLRSYARQTRKK